MNTEKTKKKEDKAGCADFVSTFKGFQEMFKGMPEGMGKCCTGQDGTIDCSTMMKSMMEICCGPKTEDTEGDSTKI
ncbi:MAG: hypothetical protein GTO24_00490 [candidate division Zixibacteria bacterium]|nr:hypothetical protein [candidate division Zixibacteria bacterium]